MKAIVASGAYLPEAVPGPVTVVLDGDRITSIWRDIDAAGARLRLAEGEVVEDVGPAALAPGFIDVHVHGSFGYDLMSGTTEDVHAMATKLPATGATAFFATIASSSPADTLRQVERIAAAARTPAGAQIVGVRLEGPFISRSKRGAQPEEAIRPPDIDELERLVAAGEGLVRMIDFAPEEDLDGSLLTAALRLGLKACVGHTAATYTQALAALDGGARHCTHLFNAMPAMGHRDPGPVGLFLTDPRPTVEVIADGIHLHPATLRLVMAARGSRSTALVTDAVAPGGLSDGDYDLLARRVTVRDGAVRLPDGTLAGSTLTLDRAVRNAVRLAGASWQDAVRMATSTPASIAGLPDRGRIAVGMVADLCALSPEGEVVATWCRGQRC